MKTDVAVVAGFFGPLLIEHVRFLKAASKQGILYVIVKNDEQQRKKRGYFSISQEDRVEIVNSIKGVDIVILSLDNEQDQVKTLTFIREKFPEHNITYFQGSDQFVSTSMPVEEYLTCTRLGLSVVFLGIVKGFYDW